MKNSVLIHLFPAAFCAALLASCGRPPTPPDPAPAPPQNASMQGLLGEMADAGLLENLDRAGADLLSSHDITSGNEDFMQAAAVDADGWITLADLSGPGILSRFWITGWSAYDQPIRMFVDGEASPRISGTVTTLFGGEFPFSEPFARHDNFCAFSYLPVPYARSLRVQIKAGKPGGKFYYHLNHAALPPGSTVTSYPAVWSDAERAAWKATAAVLASGVPARPAAATPVQHRLELKPGASVEFPPVAGPARIVRLRCTPRLDPATHPGDWQELLRGVEVEITWDGAETPSIRAPLGEFFGQAVRLTAHDSLGCSFDGTTFENRLPMPFREKAVLRLASRLAAPVALDVELAVQPLAAFPKSSGYLHCDWSVTLPGEPAAPHTVLRTAGRGRLAGVLLTVDSSVLRSWWGLEGDEILRLDDEIIPRWKGTGTEDYFNGGWYYREPVAGLYSGVLSIIPHRSVQYRWHLLDAPAWRTSAVMQFERGGLCEAPVGMESCAWSYQERPRASTSPALATARVASTGPLLRDEARLMRHVVELENLGDFSGALRLLGQYEREREPFPPVVAGMLRLRALEYRARLGRPDAEQPPRAVLGENPAPALISRAEDLEWIRAAETNALLSVAANPPVEVWYAGKSLGQTPPSGAPAVFRVAAPDAPAVIACVSTGESPEPFLHVQLRTRRTQWVSGDDWKFMGDPQPGFEAVGYDDSAWSAFPPRWLARRDLSLSLSSEPGLYSLAGNVGRPRGSGQARMAYRRVWTPH